MEYVNQSIIIYDSMIFLCNYLNFCNCCNWFITKSNYQSYLRFSNNKGRIKRKLQIVCIFFVRPRIKMVNDNPLSDILALFGTNIPQYTCKPTGRHFFIFLICWFFCSFLIFIKNKRRYFYLNKFIIHTVVQCNAITLILYFHRYYICFSLF